MAEKVVRSETFAYTKANQRTKLDKNISKMMAFRLNTKSKRTEEQTSLQSNDSDSIDIIKAGSISEVLLDDT